METGIQGIFTVKQHVMKSSKQTNDSNHTVCCASPLLKTSRRLFAETPSRRMAVTMQKKFIVFLTKIVFLQTYQTQESSQKSKRYLRIVEGSSFVSRNTFATIIIQVQSQCQQRKTKNNTAKLHKNNTYVKIKKKIQKYKKKRNT